MPPEERRIGIVFQSYALWPHMTVAENVAYGLTVAGVKDPERAKRVHAALALVELDGFAERRPALLSGGQRQRVALARCLVTEPFARAARRAARQPRRASARGDGARVRAFPQRTGTTMIYITHDQTEAMALADRIAVMDKGRVLQFATPSQLYREPADATVAKFIGEGMVVPVEVMAVHGDGTCDIGMFGHRMRMRCSGAQRLAAASACLRASALRIVAPGTRGLRARVTSTIYQGGHFRVEASVEERSEATLHLTVPEPCDVVTGAVIELAIEDGWVIPGGTAG
jgi:iron(III) transport system ATP-binding protein